MAWIVINYSYSVTVVEMLKNNQFFLKKLSFNQRLIYKCDTIVKKRREPTTCASRDVFVRI